VVCYIGVGITVISDPEPVQGPKKIFRDPPVPVLDVNVGVDTDTIREIRILIRHAFKRYRILYLIILEHSNCRSSKFRKIYGTQRNYLNM
jgi:hypothetical protein